VRPARTVPGSLTTSSGVLVSIIAFGRYENAFAVLAKCRKLISRSPVHCQTDEHLQLPASWERQKY
jgi:hypothetical protein